MSKFVKIPSGAIDYVNPDYVVKIQSLGADKDYHCRLFLADGSELELQETAEDFLKCCSTELHRG